MPIYAYRCASCGHAQDILQKMSDPLLSICPACGAAAFEKQLTAAGFQLKGSGWYVTDFRDGGGKKDAKKDAAETATDQPADAKPAGDKTASDKPAEAPVAKAAESSAPAPAPAPAPLASGS